MPRSLVLQQRLHDGAPAHFSRAVQDVLSNICHDRWTGRGEPTAWSPRSTPGLNPLSFYLWGHLTTRCSSCWQRSSTTQHCGCLSDYPQLPRHLWKNAAVHDETCRGEHWISRSTFWAIILNVLFQLSQIRCFRTHVDMNKFSCFGMWNSCPKFAPYCYILHTKLWLADRKGIYHLK
jgi:hypothetical protein